MGRQYCVDSVVGEAGRACAVFSVSSAELCLQRPHWRPCWTKMINFTPLRLSCLSYSRLLWLLFDLSNEVLVIKFGKYKICTLNTILPFFSPNDKHTKCLKSFVLFMGSEKSLCILFNSQIRIYDGNYVSLDKLTLKIPWKNLYGEAVVATLEGLYLLVVPGASMLFYMVIIQCHCNEVKLFSCEVV